MPNFLLSPAATRAPACVVSCRGDQAHMCARCAGDKPEELYPEARQELKLLGYESTLEYAADAAGTVMRETGLLPHINAGVMSLAEVRSHPPVSQSYCAP